MLHASAALKSIHFFPNVLVIDAAQTSGGLPYPVERGSFRPFSHQPRGSGVEAKGLSLLISSREVASWCSDSSQIDAFSANQAVNCPRLRKHRPVRKVAPTMPRNRAQAEACATQVSNRKSMWHCPYRVLYIFDPRRVALLLLGGDKTGDDRWYA
jgi:hypothetical protein